MRFEKNSGRSLFPTLQLSSVSALAVSIGLTVLLVIWLAWVAYQFYVTVTLDLKTQQQLISLRQELIYLDEVLTMSARMSASSGNPEWQQRYEAYVPVLDEALAKTLALVPQEVGERVKHETGEANARLVDLETQAFAAVKNKDLHAAQGLLFGTEYETQKTQYASGMKNLFDYITKSVDHYHDQAHRRASQTKTILVTILPFTLLLWGYTLQHLRRAIVNVQQSEERLTRITQGTNDGVLDLDLIGDTSYFSPRVCELLGYPPGALQSAIPAILPVALS